MTTRTLAILVLALAIPGAALAAETSTTAAPRAMYVLKGSLSDYTPASGAADGSITIRVISANYRGRLLKAKSLTFSVSAKTIVKPSGTAMIANGATGVVKFHARRKSTNAALLAALRPGHTRAYEVIDLGRFQPGT